MRDKEHEDFKMAKSEMTQAIYALNQAVATLKEATAGAAHFAKRIIPGIRAWKH